MRVAPNGRLPPSTDNKNGRFEIAFHVRTAVRFRSSATKDRAKAGPFAVVAKRAGRTVGDTGDQRVSRLKAKSRGWRAKKSQRSVLYSLLDRSFHFSNAWYRSSRSAAVNLCWVDAARVRRRGTGVTEGACRFIAPSVAGTRCVHQLAWVKAATTHVIRFS